jgi:hypothetical protein
MYFIKKYNLILLTISTLIACGPSTHVMAQVKHDEMDRVCAEYELALRDLNRLRDKYSGIKIVEVDSIDQIKMELYQQYMPSYQSKCLKNKKEFNQINSIYRHCKQTNNDIFCIQ